MASTRSTKRSAAQAELPHTEAVVIAPAPSSISAAAAAPAGPPLESMSDADTLSAPLDATGNEISGEELLARGGPAPQPQIEGFTHPVPVEAAAAAAAAEEESTAHKAKRLATEASHSVQTAVTAGLESAATVLAQAADKAKVAGEHAMASAKEWSDRELVRTKHSMGNATAANPPYNMLAQDQPQPAEPTLRDKTHNTLNTVQFAIGDSVDAAVAAAKVAGHKISEVAHSALVGAGHVVPKAVSGAEQLKEGVAHLSAQAKPVANDAVQGLKDGAGRLALETKAAAAQVKAAVTHATGVEDKNVSDASHSIEKPDGSLPMERNADEFPHPRAHVQRRVHESSTAINQPGLSGAVIDSSVVAPGGAKIDDQPASKAADTQPDLLTGGNAPVNV